MHMCGPKKYWKFYKVLKICWVFSLIFVGNILSLTGEIVWAELRQLDITGVDAAKNQLEVIEF